MRYIFIVSRLASFLADYIVFYILYYFLSPFGVLGFWILLALFFLYRVLFTAFFGSTIGMAILRLSLLKHDFKTCLKREIFRFASAFFYLGYIYSFFDENCRTLHDAASGTIVIYKGSKKEIPQTRNYIKYAAYVILIISSLRWISFFILNDIGLMGLKKVYYSDVYYQSFEGDKLVSLSQDELYKKTLGRKYTALIEKGGKKYLARISNKLKYTEVYKFNINNDRLTGEYIYTVNYPLQFICSGKFLKSIDLCGISPAGDIIIADENGKIYAKNTLKISNIISLKCGDIDRDSFDEALILGSGGDVEIFKIEDNNLNRIYYGKFGEDIFPIAFYIDGGVKVIGKGDGKIILYNYDFVNKKFLFKDKKYLKAESAGNIEKYNNNIFISNISRNSMTLSRGNIQCLKMYDKSLKLLYNFGKRPGRSYYYYVRCLEDICDIDDDGEDEIILKAAGKNDVMGQGYRIEVYKPSYNLLYINRILTLIEDILY